MQPANQPPLDNRVPTYCCFRYANSNSTATPLLDTESVGGVVKKRSLSLVDKLKELLVDPDTGRPLQADNVYIYSDGKTRNGIDQTQYGARSIACCYPIQPVSVSRNNNIANIIKRLENYIRPNNSMSEEQFIESIKAELECPISLDRMNIPGTLTTPSAGSLDKSSIENLPDKNKDPLTNKSYNFPMGFIGDKLLSDINALKELQATTVNDAAAVDAIDLMRCVVLSTTPEPSLACVVTGTRNSLACASLCALQLSCFACLSSIVKQCVPSHHWCAVSIYKHVLGFLNSKGMSGCLAKLLSDSVVGMVPYATMGVMIGVCATGCCVLRTCESSAHSDLVLTIEAQRDQSPSPALS